MFGKEFANSIKSLGVILAAILLISGCMGSFPYERKQLNDFHSRQENFILEFDTSKGRQVAFYIPPFNSPASPPARLNILYPGIYAVALDWLQFIDLNEDPDAGYLLIDYPGRGLSEGMMRPEKNYINTVKALEKLANKLGLKELNCELNLLGHSFGTGSALQFAQITGVRRIVLVAPYTTLKKAVAVKSWFLSIIMPSQINNLEIIKDLLRGENPPLIFILHGTSDTTMPVAMSRSLAAISPDMITFHEFSDDDHVGILTTRRELIFRLLNGRGS